MIFWAWEATGIKEIKKIKKKTRGTRIENKKNASDIKMQTKNLKIDFTIILSSCKYGHF